jgi:hypothetical protein
LITYLFLTHELSSVLIQSTDDGSLIVSWLSFNPSNSDLGAVVSVVGVLDSVESFSLDEKANTAHIATISSNLDEGAQE